MGRISPSLLAEHSLFADLAASDLEELSASFRRRRYARGQIIFTQGDPGNALYVVEAGLVKIALSSPDGKELILNQLRPGSFFGELALLDGEPRSADAIAQEDCQLLLLQRDDFVRFVETHPKVALKLLANLSRKLRHTTQQVEDLALLDVPARLARALLDLAGSRGKPAGEGEARTFRATQSELAAMIGATRESANKWLAYYEGQKLVRCQRGEVTILHPEALRRRIY